MISSDSEMSQEIDSFMERTDKCDWMPDEDDLCR